MNAFDERGVEMVVFCCAAQMGKTELIFAAAGKMLTDGPRVPAIYVGPTEKQVRSVSKQRISQMIRSTPALDELHMKGRYDSIGEKFFAGGVRLGFAHAGSPTELASHPCGRVFVDEYSRMENLGGEGDPMLLAKARTKNFADGKTGVFSTPTVRGICPTWSWFLEGTREVWCWRCMHCGEWFAPRRELLTWPEDATPNEARLAAGVTCPHCGGVHATSDRASLEAKYIPHDFDEDGNMTAKKIGGNGVSANFDDDNPVRSFWVSGLASPWRTFGQIAEALVRARELGDGSLQTVVNTDLGEPFELEGDAPAWNEMLEHALPYKLGDVPVGVQIVTMGVDVQKRGLYFVIRGFGYGGVSWLIDRGTIHGDTSFESVWHKLRDLMNQEVAGWDIQRVFIDSGYRPGDKHTRPQNVIYQFCKQHAKAFPSKGQPTMDKAYSAALVDVNVRGKNVRTGVKLWHINTHHWKTWVYDHIRRAPGDAEAFFVPEGIDEEYCRQVTAEQLVMSERSFKWVPHYRHNHYLDCEVLATAAAYSLGVEELKPLTAPAPVPRNIVRSEGFEPRRL